MGLITLHTASRVANPSDVALHELDLAVNAVRDYNASGSAVSTTGSISAGSAVLTLAAAEDFKNGQGISIAEAGASGALLVTSIVSGAGTTSLTLAASASMTVTGAIVQHDDTAAWQAFLTYLDTNRLAGVVPYGTYLITTPLASTGKLTKVQGSGTGASGTILHANAPMAQILTVSGGTSSFEYSGKVSDIIFDGNSKTTVANFIAKNLAWWKFENLWMGNSGKDGMQVLGCESCLLERVYATTSVRYGLYLSTTTLSDSNNNLILACPVGGNTQGGIYIDHSDGNHIINGDIGNNGTSGNDATGGVIFNFSNNGSIEDSWMESNAGYASVIVINSSNTIIRANNIYTVSTESPTDINLTQGGTTASYNTVIEDNRFLGTTTNIIDETTHTVAPHVFINRNYSSGPTVPSSAAGIQTAPTVPAANTAIQNTFGFDCYVVVSGGTGVDIGLGQTSTTTATGLASGAVIVRSGQYISLGGYSVTPTWVWIGI